MKKITVMAAVAALGVLGGVGIVGPVGASQGAVVVRGTQTPVSSTPLDPNDYTMTGGLNGGWVQTSFVLLGLTPSGGVRGSGTEVFTGCYDADGNGACGAGDPTGTINFSFTYTGRFDMSTGALLHGRCHHPVTGGTGDFAHVSGVLSFHDDPVTGCSSYTGNLRW